jgi:hypothetical protein
VQSYKRAAPSQLKRLAMDIFDNYIAVGAENQVNLSASLRESTTRRVHDARPSSDCFKDAERETLRLLSQVHGSRDSPINQ